MMEKELFALSIVLFLFGMFIGINVYHWSIYSQHWYVCMGEGFYETPYVSSQEECEQLCNKVRKEFIFIAGDAGFCKNQNAV